jgi:signal transduction histidine kinase/HAMP domain-containing protein
MNLLRTLKFQIAAALLTILVLIGGIFYLSQSALEEQQRYNMLLNLNSRLQHTVQQLVSLGMTYTMNTPESRESYRRDIKLYYTSIRDHIGLIDQITMGFMQKSFDPDLTGMPKPFRPKLGVSVDMAVTSVEEAWLEFRTGLEQELGIDSTMPQLEAAAQYISEHSDMLRESLDVLQSQIRRLVTERLNQVTTQHQSMLAGAAFVTFGIFGWFFLVVLRPLNHAVQGFHKVAQGDFGHQVPTTSQNELSLLTENFNQLSSRLHAIFLLIDRIQQGSDMNDTLCFIAEEFPSLLPLDWTGALFVTADNNTMVLESSYFDGKQEIVQRSRFRLQETLLQQAINSGEPLHISDMHRTARGNPKYQFLNHLADKGLRDAIFLPITEQSPVPGVLAFATREAERYTAEHLELLTNIAKLVTHSFGKTVKLAEHTRLAAIGGFASGIAHEIRSPLSTITMALEYFRNSDLGGAAEKRANLAHQEAERMARLLEEMLLYAKPLNLTIERLDLIALLRQLIDTHGELARQRDLKFLLSVPDQHIEIQADPDRMKQVFLNLLRNACDAADEASVVDINLTANGSGEVIAIAIHNHGKAIPPELQPRLFDAFFTTKQHGTGLGLGIVKRIVEAHGGDIRIESSQNHGTSVHLHLPRTT